MSTLKMAQALVAADADLAALEQREPLTIPQAEAYVRNQKACVVCGHGIMVFPWGSVVPEVERVLLGSIGSAENGRGLVVPIHAKCLLEPSAGRRISDELGFTQPEL